MIVAFLIITWRLFLGTRLPFELQVSNRVFFAGEGTSRFRFGYVDGAYDTGIREAHRILSMCNSTVSVPYVSPETGFRPANDADIRAVWSVVMRREAQVLG